MHPTQAGQGFERRPDETFYLTSQSGSLICPFCEVGGLECTLEVGYLGTALVCEFEPSGHGLHNVFGNVWEWCSE